MKRLPPILSTLLIAAALLGGCGGDTSSSSSSSVTGASGASGVSGSQGTEGSTSSSGSDEGTSAPGSSDGAAAAGALSDEDKSEIEDAAKNWLTKGGCDLMTDRFLEKQTFEKNPEIACKTFENLFQPPSFSADQITVTSITGDENGASAKIGDTLGTGVRSTYKFKKVDGAWQIDQASP